MRCIRQVRQSRPPPPHSDEPKDLEKNLQGREGVLRQAVAGKLDQLGLCNNEKVRGLV